MKLIKTANGKQTVKMSKAEWENIGKKQGWNKSELLGWDEEGLPPTSLDKVVSPESFTDYEYDKEGLTYDFWLKNNKLVELNRLIGARNQKMKEFTTLLVDDENNIQVEILEKEINAIDKKLEPYFEKAKSGYGNKIG